ncbi:MAG: ribonuclease P protein component [Gemmatimonadaceae bacterium]|jgi:ribonuclease P protein component|nr:ribonuclease P protein component [Gemmatimonadaceae bacterium]
MSQSFGRQVRLRARAEFVAVQGQGRRVASRHLTLLALPNTLGVNRLGVVASRRLGGAVQRNRAKRRLREMFRATQPEVPVTGQAYDIVVIPRREITSHVFSELKSEFDAALRKLHAR